MHVIFIQTNHFWPYILQLVNDRQIKFLHQMIELLFKCWLICLFFYWCHIIWFANVIYLTLPVVICINRLVPRAHATAQEAKFLFAQKKSWFFNWCSHFNLLAPYLALFIYHFIHINIFFVKYIIFSFIKIKNK